MKRILVIGCPGAGKSTFARALRDRLNLPLYHLDMLFWNADKTTVSRDEFDRKLAKILQKDEWIVDGNYNRTLETRLKRCDTVFFLDFPKEVCLEGIKKRVGTKREDMPFVETQIDGELLRLVENFEKDSRPKIIELLQKNKSSDVKIFNSREEMSRFLQNISLT